MHDDDGTDIGQALFVSTFSEWTVVPMHSVVKIFDHYPLHRACLTACGVVAGIGTAIYLGDIKPGAVCAVWGVGGIGMNIVQGCRLKGARAIVAVDLVDWKLEKAREFGATHTVNPSKQDTVAFINELSWGRGADNTFEAIATPETIAGTRSRHRQPRNVRGDRPFALHRRGHPLPADRPGALPAHTRSWSRRGQPPQRHPQDAAHVGGREDRGWTPW